MSAHVEVVSTDFRRAKVKVLPGTYLVDVLNEACKKLNLNGDRYLLKSVKLRAPRHASN
jgi:tether containing UBX domain for GLUT4